MQDLITYQVQSINPMVLQEAVEGTGMIISTHTLQPHPKCTETEIV